MLRITAIFSEKIFRIILLSALSTLPRQVYLRIGINWFITHHIVIIEYKVLLSIGCFQFPVCRSR